MGDLGFIQCLWFHSHAPWGSIGSFRVVGFAHARPGCHAGSYLLFTHVRPGCRWVHQRRVHRPASLGLLATFVIVEFTRVRTAGRYVHPGSLAYAVGVVGFIRARWVRLLGLFSSSGVFGVTRPRPERRCVHPESLSPALAVVGF